MFRELQDETHSLAAVGGGIVSSNVSRHLIPCLCECTLI